MTQLELFAGIGGFGLGGHWAGIETVCQVEIDPFCQKVLAKNFPNAHKHDDIKTFDGTQWRGVDIISGGFPCQPYSTAGKRLGTADERHLWPEMLRVIREASPRWVLGENVSGLISWSNGLVFEQVCADLEAEGYEVQPFILPACAVNAPHRRDRVWFVAYATRNDGRRNAGEVSKANGRQERGNLSTPTCAGKIWDASDAGGERLQGQVQSFGSCEHGKKRDFALRPDAANSAKATTGRQPKWDTWTSEPALCRMDDGISYRLDKHRLKALGNAIVPQVAYQIFKAIIETENLHNERH